MEHGSVAERPESRTEKDSKACLRSFSLLNHLQYLTLPVSHSGGLVLLSFVMHFLWMPFFFFAVNLKCKLGSTD